MRNEPFDFSTIRMLHEHLCLDFVNTTPNHQNPSEDYLDSYVDLVSWGLDVGLLNMDEAQRLWEVANQRPSQAAALHQKAVTLREAIYRILLSITKQQTPESADMDTLNAALAETMSHMRMIPSDNGFAWAWDGDTSHPEYLLWRVAWSAGELLMSDSLKYLRKCDGCDWMFLDTSRSRRRRWCDMNTCGNRAKARRHYTRTRGG